MSGRTILAWLMAAAILIGGFAWLAGWFNPRTAPGLQARPAAGELQRPVVRVAQRETANYLPVPGRLWAERRTRVTSEITGTITEITVVAGDQVEAGELLVQLDTTELSARASRIEEQMPAAEQRVQETQAQFERDQELLRDDAVSREALETSRRRFAEAKSALAATRQELVEARGRLDEATIEATMSGTVVDQLAKVGEVARPGRTLLEVYQPNTLRLECQVPESLIGRLEVSQSVPAEIGKKPGRTTVTVDEIVPQADPRSRTMLVKARIESPDESPDALFEGQYGRLLVPLEQRRKLIIPLAALQSIGQLDFVEVVGDSREIERRFVKRGPLLPPDDVEVLSGLEAGERVVLISKAPSESGG